MREKGTQSPQDSEKLGYKFLLDSLREQLLKGRTIQEPQPEPKRQLCPSPFSVDIPLPELPPGKKYFRIGEVAQILAVESHVLRYWESEFSPIRPKKSRSGQRIYDRKDVELLATVRFLLHDEKFSLQGAKQKLNELRKSAKSPLPPRKVEPQVLRELAMDLRSLMAAVRNGPY